MTTKWIGRWLRCRRSILAALLVCATAEQACAQSNEPRPTPLPRTERGSNSRCVAIFRSATQLQDSEQFGRAEAQWATLIKRFPNDALVGKAHHYRGVCLVRMGRFEDAETEFAVVIAKHAGTASSLLESAYANLGYAQYRRACDAHGAARLAALDASIDTFARQLERFPGGTLVGEAHYYRAEAYMAQQKPTDALAGYQALLTRFPQHSLRRNALFGLGVAAQEAGQLDIAIEAFDNLLIDFPANPLCTNARLRSGEIRFHRGEVALAVDDLFAAAQDTGSPAAERARRRLLDVAREVYARSNPRTAVAIIDRFVNAYRDDKQSAEAYYLRGECRVALDDTTGAERDFKRAAEVWPASPHAPDALLQLADLALARGEYSATQIIAGRFLVNYRNHERLPYARLLRAKARYETGQFDGAIVDLESAGTTHAGAAHRADAEFVRGMCEARLNHTSDALERFRSLQREFPGYEHGDRVLYELGGLYETLGQERLAAWAYRRIYLEYRPSALCSDACLRIAKWQLGQRDFSGAELYLGYAIELASDQHDKERAIHQLGWCRFSQSKWQEAQQAFARQLEEFPEGDLAADARTMLAECKFQRQQFAEAHVSFSMAIRKDEARGAILPLALLHGGICANHVEDWAQAESLLSRYLHDYPNTPDTANARCERGTALFNLGRQKDARGEFERIAASNNDPARQAQAQFMLGEIHMAHEQYEEALRSFTLVADGESDPTLRGAIDRWKGLALFEAARCLEILKRSGSAQDLYRELLTRYPDSERAPAARIALRELGDKSR